MKEIKYQHLDISEIDPNEWYNLWYDMSDYIDNS